MIQQPLNLPNELPIARYRFTFELTSSLEMPIYAGSTLRGVFGHALKDLICTCGQPEKHTSNCPYNSIFNTTQSELTDLSQKNSPPQSYLFEPQPRGKSHYAAGEHYHFDMVLIGHSRLLLSLIISALQLAFQRGVGSAQGKGKLIDVAIEHQQTWQSIYVDHRLIRHNNALMLPESYSNNVQLHFQTPLRLQQKGKILRPEQIQASHILRQLMRRLSSLSQLYFPQAIQADFASLKQNAEETPSQAQWTWQNWQRYSNRQQQNMQLGGVIGHITLCQLTPEFATMLYIGQWLHIGKETVFGLGKYQLQAV